MSRRMAGRESRGAPRIYTISISHDNGQKDVKLRMFKPESKHELWDRFLRYLKHLFEMYSSAEIEAKIDKAEKCRFRRQITYIVDDCSVGVATNNTTIIHQVPFCGCVLTVTRQQRICLANQKSSHQRTLHHEIFFFRQREQPAAGKQTDNFGMQPLTLQLFQAISIIP